MPSQYAKTTLDNGGSFYPLTKMNFVVTVKSANGNTAKAAFSEVTGIEATVDVIEFRQGNSESLSPVKVPGLVKHGNVTLKFGYTTENEFKKWVDSCIGSTRKGMDRTTVSIELIDIVSGDSPTALQTTLSNKGNTWILENAWVTKYTAPDLNAMQSEIAIESVEIAYETLKIPTVGSTAAGSTAAGTT